MARRYNYKWNTQNITCGKLSTLNVLNKIEVVPGDTISGKMGIVTKFENFKKTLLNDLLVDYWMVYVPHRIAWDGWTDFITRKSDDVVPVYTDAKFMLEPNDSSTNEHNALDLLAYSKVYKQFFCREEMYDEVNNINNLNLNADGIPSNLSADQSTHGMLTPYVLGDLYSAATTKDSADINTNFYPTDAENYSNNPDQLETTDPSLVDLHNNQDVAGDLNTRNRLDLDTLYRQEAIYAEARNRARYGDGYEDLLNRWGVTVPDAMLERAEVLVHKRDVTQITDVVATSEEGLGKTGGHGQITSVLECGKKLIPEHGTVLVLQTIRPQCGASHVARSWHDTHNKIDDYFDPFLLNANLPDRKIADGDVEYREDNDFDPFRGYIPNFEWYRRPKGTYCHDSLMFNNSKYIVGADPSTTSVQSRMPTYTTYNALFGSLTNIPQSGHYVTGIANKLNIQRPIPPKGILKN